MIPLLLTSLILFSLSKETIFMKLIAPTRLILTLILLITCFSFSPAQTGNRAAVLDFDGDGKTDYAVVRISSVPTGNVFKTTWYINESSSGPRGVQWGVVEMNPVPADYDGDGKWDIAVWDGYARPEGTPAYFHIWRSSDNTYQRIAWGMRFDDPRQTQDFDGDGKADPTVVRCEGSSGNSYWYSLLSGTGEVRVEHFGFCGDRELRGDYDGDGKADLAVYRPGVGTEQNYFIVKHSSDNQMQFYPFGRSIFDSALTGTDFDGDGKTDYCVVRLVEEGEQGELKYWWYWVESSTGEVHSRQFGNSLPEGPRDAYAPGDYDGDGRTDLAVWRRGGLSAHFYVARSRDGMYVMPWGGTPQDAALAGNLQFR